jgi:hypothetical protein
LLLLLLLRFSCLIPLLEGEGKDRDGAVSMCLGIPLRVSHSDNIVDVFVG